MFAVVIWAAITESQAPVRLGLLNTYKSLFSLDDSLAEIKTLASLSDYLKTVSKQARLIQPLSSAYFVEETGQLKILSGLHDFEEKRVLDVAGLAPRVDSPAWSLMAWVQLRKNGGANILRKPLGKSQAEKDLSCWGWHVGVPSDRFDFGAHDFRGGSVTSAMQETVTSNSNAAADGLLHNMALVVNSSSITFYMDAKVHAVVPISRPVTDCSGLGLEVGDATIPTLGEITFFARALTQIEMEEIMASGSTLSDIAVGKLMFAPEATSFDMTTSKNEEAFARAQDAVVASASSTRVDGSLTRQTVYLTGNPTVIVRDPPIMVNNSSPCPAIQVFGNTTSCHIMTLSEEDAILDTTLNYSYFPLIKPQYMPPGRGVKDRAFLAVRKTNELLRYDPVAFPSWCGTSATFSVWLENEGVSGYIISRYKTSEVPFPEKFWILVMSTDGTSIRAEVPHPGVANKQENPGYGAFKANIPRHLGGVLASMKPGQRRHVAWTFNHVTDITCAYLDGYEVHCEQQMAGSIRLMDCGMNNPETAFVGLNYRTGGARQAATPVQDWRYYRQALSAQQVRKLAYDSVDGAGKNLRTCVLSTEGFDKPFVDMDGNECQWYEEMRKTKTKICSTPEVQENCPMACGMKLPCWEGPQAARSTFSIWNKIMLLTDSVPPAKGKVCVREGIDAVSECRKIASNPSIAVTPPGAQAWAKDVVSYMDTELFTAWNTGNISKYCDVLEQMADSRCAFAAPWTQKINTEIKKQRGFTIDFWWKALPRTKIRKFASDATEIDVMPRMTFFSHMTPPARLATVSFQQDRGVFVEMYGACAKSEIENVNELPPSGKFENGVWYRAALQLGTRFPAGHSGAGTLGMSVSSNSKTSMDFADWDWCLDDTKDFIQGMLLPGGILMSSIEVTATPIPAKEMQQRFYEQFPNFRVRRGPVADDETRMTAPIGYTRATYQFPVSLVSPPILMQTRVEKTAVCKNKLGSSYQDRVWKDMSSGVICEFPYECDEGLLNTSTALMACSAGNFGCEIVRGQCARSGSKQNALSIPPEFFGRPHQNIQGEQQFFEFLTTIADASILVRNGEMYETASFLDAQTTSVTVAMMAFSPEFGIASKILIKAEQGAEMKVDFLVSHFQSLEDDNLIRYYMACIAGFVLAGVILIEKVGTVYGKVWEEERLNFVVDVVVQVVLPIVYFAVRLIQVRASKDAISETVGIEGLSGVPWASRSTSLTIKMDKFFESVQKFDDLLFREKSMEIFYFAHATSALIRVIFQTSVHPRTGILVNTMVKAVGDLWHWVILYMLLNFGFIMLGIAQFGSEKKDFSTVIDTFETLWEMLLGAMLESGDIPSSTWTFNPLIFAYLMLYNICMFMIMFNFIIAIIVESYMQVVREVEEDESEQEFFTDITSVTVAGFKSALMRWPRHPQLIKRLKNSPIRVINYAMLRVLFPGWNSSSMTSFLNYYSQYEFMDVSYCPEESEKFQQEQMVQKIVKQVEERMSVMVGCAIPTAGERVMELSRLDRLIDQEREKEPGVLARILKSTR